MYRIFVAAAEFQGKRTIQQHRIINDVRDIISLSATLIMLGVYKWLIDLLRFAKTGPRDVSSNSSVQILLFTMM